MMPALIIHPKLITGRISQSNRELKPAIVVKAAYRHGVNLDLTVFRTNVRWSLSGCFFMYSRYRTIRWTDMARVIINWRDTKFEEITVTSQSNIPSMPIMARTDRKQQSIGKIIHRSLLKIMPSMPTRRKKTPTPNTFRSFLMKVIISSAIMLMPPRKRSASDRYFSITARTARMFSCCVLLILSRCRLICSPICSSSMVSVSVKGPSACLSRRRFRFPASFRYDSSG